MTEFRIDHKCITQEELREFEEQIQLVLPEDYKAHMLTFNGGSPLTYYIYFGEPDDGINLSGFKPIKYGEDLVEAKDHLPQKHLSIGYTETGYLAMSLDQDNYGSIFVYYSEAELKKIASSFTEFLEGLADHTRTF